MLAEPLPARNGSLHMGLWRDRCRFVREKMPPEELAAVITSIVRRRPRVPKRRPQRKGTRPLRVTQ